LASGCTCALLTPSSPQNDLESKESESHNASLPSIPSILSIHPSMTSSIYRYDEVPVFASIAITVPVFRGLFCYEEVDVLVEEFALDRHVKLIKGILEDIVAARWFRISGTRLFFLAGPPRARWHRRWKS